MRGLNKLALALIATTTLGACVVRGSGHARVWVPGPVVVVEQPPPPPPPRRVVVVRPGHIWIEGRYHWNGNRYVWHDGYYERERSGYHYTPGRWQRQGRGHVWVEGTWRAGGRGHVRSNNHNRGRAKVRDHR
jgi:hypothetical protein